MFKHTSGERIDSLTGRSPPDTFTPDAPAVLIENGLQFTSLITDRIPSPARAIHAKRILMCPQCRIVC